MGFRHYYWTRGEPWNGIRNWLAPQMLRAAHAALMCSLRITTSGKYRAQAFEQSTAGRGALLVTWHDLTMVFLHLLRNKRLVAIASPSRSGRTNAAFLRLLGINVVWGSSGKRAGVQALREVLPLLREGRIVLVVPDGPKGPRHRAQPGIVFLASRAEVTIYPWGLAASSSWRLSTWDRHLIPKPFSRVHLHMGEPLHLPSAIGREEIPRWQEIISQAIDAAEATARENLAAIVSRRS